MPELPDVTVYVERLGALAIGQPLEAIRIASPFVLRTVSPSPGELRGAAVVSVRKPCLRFRRQTLLPSAWSYQRQR